MILARAPFKVNTFATNPINFFNLKDSIAQHFRYSSTVIALTTRIQQIQTHLRQNKKDKHSKRGLDALYVRRRKMLDYMERKDFESYRKVVKTLGLVH